GLFARAIIQSGSAICPRSLGDAHRDVAYHTAAVVGCHQWDSYELLQCLQEARAEELVLILPKYIKWRYLPILLGPRVDGDFLPDDPEVLARDGRHKKVDIISGITSHDGGAFVTGERVFDVTFHTSVPSAARKGELFRQDGLLSR
ncbi:hypothetical protein OTU49_007197, partial [Cherax quadricarinatus]